VNGIIPYDRAKTGRHTDAVISRHRLEDVIKSGGEWISSIEIENLAMSHPEVFEAAVIAVAHPAWQERPLLMSIRATGGVRPSSRCSISCRRNCQNGRFPDDVAFVESLPHTATGKLLKTELRHRFHGRLAVSA
jgi:fatty-acyl-CoA synthase